MCRIALIVLLAVSIPAGAAEPKSRTFQFTYETTITGLQAHEHARVWLPVASSSSDQKVEIVEKTVPGSARIEVEPKYGNRILYCEAQGGRDVALRVIYKVTRNEVKANGSGAVLREEAEKFLKPDARVPAEGKYLKLLDGKELPKDQVKAARQLYDLVNAELRYSKEGTGWGQGDVEWVCDSKHGNCSDFHSLFIGLARSQGMPGRFEIGFSLPEKRGNGDIAGYHCWAKVRPSGMGWLPVDISEANRNPRLRDYYFGHLSEDRVAFSIGRDLTMVPKQDGPPLNFHIDPYVEVGGKPYAADKVKKRFAYEDVP